jgi:HD-GYP domain-containing protein (c-di-GMP phosphodiesterase class II)
MPLRADTNSVATLMSETERRDLPRLDQAGLIRSAVEAARKLFGMDMACLAETRAGVLEHHTLVGAAESFGARRQETMSLSGTYSALLLDQALDGLVRDASTDPRVAALPVTRTARIGAYLGVPVHLPNRKLFGTFSCLSHAADPSLRERDVCLMRVLAQAIGEQLDREADAPAEDCRSFRNAHVVDLLIALEARDGDGERHAQAVVALAIAVAEELGLERDAMRDMRCAALLHDIGKVGISEKVLCKSGTLTREEWEEVRRHPIIGERMIRSMPGLWHLAPVIRAAHERWDGSGYPDGLAAGQIPLISRIVLVCDAYHAMTSDRPYRRAMSHEAAREQLGIYRGAHFFPGAVDAILRVLDRPDP